MQPIQLALAARLKRYLLCREGNLVKEIASLPLAEDIPIAFNSCRKGPRSVHWRDDKPHELTWTECQVPSLSSTRRVHAAPCSFRLLDRPNM